MTFIIIIIIIIIIIVFVRRGAGGGGNVYKASTDETINYPITTNERIKVFSRN
jgi:preprotein translocase subunit SecG